MKTYTQRINNIIGQLNGVNKMLDEKKDCISTLTQIKAVRSAINSLMNKIIEESLDSCSTVDRDHVKNIIKEMTKL